MPIGPADAATAEAEEAFSALTVSDRGASPDNTAASENTQPRVSLPTSPSPNPPAAASAPPAASPAAPAPADATEAEVDPMSLSFDLPGSEHKEWWADDDDDLPQPAAAKALAQAPAQASATPAHQSTAALGSTNESKPAAEGKTRPSDMPSPPASSSASQKPNKATSQNGDASRTPHHPQPKSDHPAQGKGVKSGKHAAGPAKAAPAPSLQQQQQQKKSPIPPAVSRFESSHQHTHGHSDKRQPHANGGGSDLLSRLEPRSHEQAQAIAASQPASQAHAPSALTGVVQTPQAVPAPMQAATQRTLMPPAPALAPATALASQAAHPPVSAAVMNMTVEQLRSRSRFISNELRQVSSSCARHDPPIRPTGPSRLHAKAPGLILCSTSLRSSTSYDGTRPLERS